MADPAGGAGGRRTQAERRALTEAALLRAAAELVVASGVRSLTLASVGERAGYSRGIVTHYFGSKRGLLHALARSTQTAFVPGLEDRAPGLERLLDLIAGYLGALESNSAQWRVFVLLWAEAATSPDLAPILRERDEQFRAELRDDIEAAIAQRTIRRDADPVTVSIAILGQLRGIGLQRLIDRDAVDLKRLRRSVPDDWRRALTSS